MFNLKLLRITALLLLLWPAQICLAQQSYTVNQIPDPKAMGGNGYVSNPDAVLNPGDVDGLNQTIAQLEAQTHVQIAVVVVRNFDENAEMFDFALQLFRKWGIGKANANNGLLLFVAIDRREYRFITGYGLEGLLPDVTLQKIGDKFLVPAFKEQAYGDGITTALNTVAEYLSDKGNKAELDHLLEKKNPGEIFDAETAGICGGIILVAVLIFFNSKKYMSPKVGKTNNNGYDNVVATGCGSIAFLCFVTFFIMAFTTGFDWVKDIKPASVPYIVYAIVAIFLMFRYYGVLGSNRRFYKDDENFSNAVLSFNRVAWLYIIASPLILIGILTEVVRRIKTVKRFRPLLDANQQPMTRVNRDKNRDGHPYITPGQLNEENAGAYIYDIWLSANNKKVKVIANKGSRYGSFDECPQCKFKTFCKPKTVTLVAATYSRQGSGKKVRLCENCKYELLIKMLVFPILTKSSSSSSSSGGGSSSGGSSSSSWGGGSSGGGGAGGKW